MKTILLLLFTTICFSQTYEAGAGTSNGLNFPMKMKIIITDKEVVLQGEGKPPATYKIVNNVNGIVYFTDGVMTDYFTFLEKKGTKKGFDYTTMIFCTFDQRKGLNTTLIYYCNKL